MTRTSLVILIQRVGLIATVCVSFANSYIRCTSPKKRIAIQLILPRPEPIRFLGEGHRMEGLENETHTIAMRPTRWIRISKAVPVMHLFPAHAGAAQSFHMICSFGDLARSRCPLFTSPRSLNVIFTNSYLKRSG